MSSLNNPFPAYKGTLPYIFISYAHLDSEKVFPIIREFQDTAYHLWFDEGIDPGNEWPEEVANALEKSALFVVFISPNSVNSVNVRNEINFALADNIPFIAIHLEETRLTAGLKLQIGAKQAIMKYRMDEASFRQKYIHAFEVMGMKLPAGMERAPTIAIPQSPSSGNGAARANDLPPAVSAVPAPAWGTDIDDYETSFLSILKKYTGASREIKIPMKFTRIFVTAFSHCDTLEKVIVPDYVTELSVAAFDQCQNLKSVLLEGTQMKIGVPNFVDCPKLTVTCHKESLTYENLKRAYNGPIDFFEDAIE